MGRDGSTDARVLTRIRSWLPRRGEWRAFLRRHRSLLLAFVAGLLLALALALALLRSAATAPYVYPIF